MASRKVEKKEDEGSISDDIVWTDAGSGYGVALVDGKVVARNAKGARLASVPKAIADSEAVERLRALVEWLATHDKECAENVETWMLRSLPVPRNALVAVWPDPSWRRPLDNAVVAPMGEDARPDLDQAGFLKDLDSTRGVGIVNLDGETVWLDVQTIAIPHPTLLPELASFRELATELGLEQVISQLFRETFTPAPTLEPGVEEIIDYANATFEQLNHALGRCRTLGYRVRGGFACCPVWEGSRLTEARFWIGAEDPEWETQTGNLCWVDGREHQIPVHEVGPVAYSEGMRMAAAIAAGAKKADEKAED